MVVVLRSRMHVGGTDRVLSALLVLSSATTLCSCASCGWHGLSLVPMLLRKNVMKE